MTELVLGPLSAAETQQGAFMCYLTLLKLESWWP
jgi:hypothetical protein